MSRLFPTDKPWPVWQKWLFRVVFVFMVLLLDLPEWLSWITGYDNPVFTWYSGFRKKAVIWANNDFFHIRPELVMPMGSGDASFSWAMLCFCLSVTVPVVLIWGVADRRRPDYEKLGYWFRNFLRYYVASVAFIYGMIKITLGQMGTLSPVDLATPVGNLSLMRMCWYFIAASPPYQFYSGLMELTVAFLLLWRRTTTFGLLMGLAVFANVFVLNLSYDIPVKLFSGELVLCCILLLFREYERIVSFFILNRATAAGSLFNPPYRSLFFRIFRWGLKGSFLVLVIAIPGWTQLKTAREQTLNKQKPVLPPGVYGISGFRRMGDTVGRTNRPWTMLVFDSAQRGSMTGDSTRFKYRYGRSLFDYHADSERPNTVVFKGKMSDNPAESPPDSLSLHYELAEPGRIHFSTQIGVDSVQFDAIKADHEYPLGRWQFHWLTEYVP